VPCADPSDRAAGCGAIQYTTLSLQAGKAIRKSESVQFIAYATLESRSKSQDVVRLGVGLIATIAALVLGLLIAAAKSSFDTQSSQIKQFTADLILLDDLLGQHGPETTPIRARMRSAVAPLADRIWREKSASTKGTFEINAKSEALLLEIQVLSPRNDVQRSLQARAVQISTSLARTRLLLFVGIG